MTTFSRLSVAVCLLALAACQTMPYQPYARDVKKKPAVGGVIALNTDHREEDRMKATEMMKGNCGANPFKIVEEGEVVVGQTTNASSTADTNYGGKHQVGTLFGMPLTSGSDKSATTNTTASTTQLKEWQINYECEVAATEAPQTVHTAKAAKVSKKKAAN